MKKYRLKKDFIFPNGNIKRKNTIFEFYPEKYKGNYVYVDDNKEMLRDFTHSFQSDFISTNKEFFEEVEISDTKSNAQNNVFQDNNSYTFQYAKTYRGLGIRIRKTTEKDWSDFIEIFDEIDRIVAENFLILHSNSSKIFHLIDGRIVEVKITEEGFPQHLEPEPENLPKPIFRLWFPKIRKLNDNLYMWK